MDPSEWSGDANGGRAANSGGRFDQRAANAHPGLVADSDEERFLDDAFHFDGGSF